eukprot:COSAG05_NODE_14_length_36349_cov_27.641655_22_plen_80_part_00
MTAFKAVALSVAAVLTSTPATLVLLRYVIFHGTRDTGTDNSLCPYIYVSLTASVGFVASLGWLLFISCAQLGLLRPITP